MVGVTEIRTGNVWLAELDPTIGHEQRGRRPVVVVSSASPLRPG
jgi:mRNA interferase MazF